MKYHHWEVYLHIKKILFEMPHICCVHFYNEKIIFKKLKKIKRPAIQTTAPKRDG
uniref:Uncharacterized protein n=1 Tax=Anguilla anguilla TaxID=7936 RepID=A0A0E9TF88_ANGAN